MVMLKAIFFDAVGTLIYLPRPVGDHYREVALQFGADMTAADLTRAFHTAWKKSPAKTSTRRPRAEDDKGWWRNLVNGVLAEVLPAADASTFDASGFFEAVYAHFAEPGVWSIYPEVPEVLARLREDGLVLAVISNFDRRLHTVFEDLQLSTYFKQVVVSSEVGADKPDPFIFQCALEVMRVSPEEAIHVGDDPKCDWGAVAVGLPVFRLERPANTLQDLFALIETRDAT